MPYIMAQFLKGVGIKVLRHVNIKDIIIGRGVNYNDKSKEILVEEWK